MDEPFDLAVVGAGPGGSAAASAALAAGLSVVQLERATLPRVKPCAGGLTVKSLRALPSGLEGTFKSTFEEVEFGFLRGPGRRFTYRGPLLAMVSRPELDAALVDRNRGRTGFHLLAGEAVCRIEWKGDHFLLETPGRRITARQLVGADGAGGIVARSFTGAPPRARAVALEVDVPLDGGWRLRPDAPCFDFGVVPRGYGWVFPKGDHATVGIYSLARPLERARACLWEYLALKGYRGGPSAGLEVLAHLVPVGGRLPRRSDLPLYLVGDAGGFADALLGEGIYHALESGRLAGEAAARVARDGARPGSYRKALLRRVLPDTWVTWWTAQLVYALPRVALWLLVGAGLGRPFLCGYGRGATFAECCWRAPWYLLLSFWRRTVKTGPPRDLMETPCEPLPPSSFTSSSRG